MPFSAPGSSAIFLSSLGSVSLVGVGTPKLARALGTGLSIWTKKIAVSTTDTGSAGTGKGVPIPILLAPPVVYGNLVSAFRGQGILGMMAPVFIAGLTSGIVQSYATALTNTIHAGVGVGAGIATFRPPPAFVDIKAGFSSVGATGDGATKICRALSQAMESTFRSLLLPQPIVGTPSTSPGSGKGFGTIL